MEKEKFKKSIILILIALIGLFIIINIQSIGNVLGTIFRIVNPFILGGSLAFILNIPMSFFERKLQTKKNKKRNKKTNKKTNENSKFLRVISIIFAILVILVILTIIITLIVPELVNVIGILIDNIPYYAEQLTILAEKYNLNIPNLNTIIEEANLDMETIKQNIVGVIPNLVTSSLSFVENPLIALIIESQSFLTLKLASLKDPGILTPLSIKQKSVTPSLG